MSEHIVEFENWCKKCKFGKQDEEEHPCYLCLDEPVNIDSKKPVYYVEGDTKKKERYGRKEKTDTRRR